MLTFIQKEIKKKNNFKILISNSNLQEKKELNLFLNEQPYQINWLNRSNFYPFFNFSLLNPFSDVIIKLNNINIHLNLKTETIFPPNYKNYIFDDNYFAKKKNYFVGLPIKNILIIEDIELIEYKYIYIIDCCLRMIFDKSKPFGGINIIFLGNFFNKTNIYSFYDSIILKKKDFSLYYCKNNINSNIELYKNNLIIPDTLYNSWKKLNFNIKTNTVKDVLFISKNTTTINKYNKSKIGKNGIKVYINFSFKEIYFQLSEHQQKQIKNFFFLPNVLYLKKKIFIIFIKDIKSRQIKAGQEGKIIKIYYKNKKKERNFISTDIKYISVKINEEIHQIEPFEYTFEYKNNIYYTKIQFPFVVKYCIHMNLIKKIIKPVNLMVLILDENSLPEYIEYVSKAKCDNFLIQNTILLTNKYFFFKSVSFKSFIENMIRLHNLSSE